MKYLHLFFFLVNLCACLSFVCYPRGSEVHFLMEVGDVGASGGLHSARCRSLRKDHSIISGNLEFSHSVEINDRVTSLSHVG